MRVLMFGWEFPPHISGGLGTACHGMTQALARQGVDIVFLVPSLKGDGKGMDAHLSLRSASGTKVRRSTARTIETLNEELWQRRIQVQHVDSLLFAYATQQSYALREQAVREMRQHTQRCTVPHEEEQTLTLRGDYGADLLQEVQCYGQAGAALALQEQAGRGFDVIHAHDWMTYPAGMLAKKLTGKPLVVHVHATEYDRSGENINPDVAAIERAGMLAADVVMVVSHLTRSLVVQRYNVPPEKVVVVHNAVSRHDARQRYDVPPLCHKEKRVLFMGRVTFQKGPEYFVEAAAEVLRRMPNVRFIMAGSGDMLPRMVRRAGQLRIGNRLHFPGFMRGAEVDRMYAMSDLYVMPSVSEPFGIAPLEAVLYDVPVMLSYQSGVAEVLHNALKVNFWDTHEMASKICAVLSYPKLAAAMVKNCREELKTITWDKAAAHIRAAYARVCHAGG
ncbi:MAG: glycosyltransferase family 4 protein [Desulfovibrionaceae bacterium]|nr:glycosyltransferase family 4 protein [Desulfovibrionaceae bacterium]